MGVALIMLMICGTTVSLLQNVRATPTVLIGSSQIVGRRFSLSGHGVHQYLGIPFAQPPVGPLRFKKPLPFQNYTPVFQAIISPPACPQYSDQFNFDYGYYDKPSKVDEDCLYLNIWTPAKASPTNKKAVFFYVYGGGYRYGSNMEHLYSGIPLCSLGDMIVVTVNYRVGSFGFLTSGTADAPPNVGLWDILEGLKWVNRHIESFGGDSDRITLAGQSAGAISVGLLTISPLARGLFARQIMESGSPITHLTDNNTANVALAQQLAKKVGCSNDTYTIEMHPEDVVQCLRGVDSETLSRADFDLAPYRVFVFLPQWGDDLLPENPRVAIKEGHFACKDLLIGNNLEEGALFLIVTDPALYGPYGRKNIHYNKTFGQEMIQKTVDSFPDSQSIVQYYLPDHSPSPTFRRIRHQVFSAVGESGFVCPSMYYGQKCAEQNRNVHYYFFTHRPSDTPLAKWTGVTHAEELRFVFGKPISNPEFFRPSEAALSRRMIDIWSQFVKHGKPNIPWPLYSRENHFFHFLGPDNVYGRNEVDQHLKNCKFLRPFY